MRLTAEGAATRLEAARLIVEDVRARGEEAVRERAERLDGLPSGEPLFWDARAVRDVADRLETAGRDVIERSADRIRLFAQAQRDALSELYVAVPGGRAGHTARAMDRAGCYVPGGRYPLPSSALMTVVPARVAGVAEVWAASPRPGPAVCAALLAAGVDGLLAAGGAHAVAAMAYSCGPVRAADVVVGPGGVWVTAAKRLVSGDVAIDMLAGPSELVVIADSSADPRLVAADLLAQAEHDPLARPILLTPDRSVAEAVAVELARQIESLPTRETAATALDNGFALVAEPTRLIEACNEIAPEHLQLSVADPDAWRLGLRHYGGLFVGERSAEVFGDYGVGPNHTLPTGGTARHVAGLSVFTFLRVQTWLEIDPDESLVRDTAALARLEGLEAHARAAEARAAAPVPA